MRSDEHRENGRKHGLAAVIASRYWHAADAERVLAAWRESALSGAAFARRHGLSRARLIRWRDRLKGTTPRFHPVRIVGGEPVSSATTRVLELELRGGRRIRVPADFDPELLERLVRTVESWGC